MKPVLIVAVVLVAGWALWRTVSARHEPPTPETTTPLVNSTLVNSGAPAIPQKDAVAGASFNSAFPAATGDYKLVFAQEKAGFAQADLSKGGVKQATLSVSDTNANPGARDKFKTGAQRIAGFPSAAVGAMGTALLVEDRYQVQVRSLTPAFTAADREHWLSEFKLNKLAGLKAGEPGK